jgi:hypothetical protein
MTEPDEPLTGPGTRLEPGERDSEAPDADVMEQTIPADPVEQDAEIRHGIEVNDWDAIEQSRVVDLEDEY